MGSNDREIEQFRQEHEPDEHWELRREFLETHFENFPTSKLECLSQTYANIEILGCRYPAETMKIIAELAAGLGKAHRNRQERQVQKFTVDASNAAEQKIKRRMAGGFPGGNNQGQPKVTYGPNVFGGPSVNYGPPVFGRGGHRS